MIASKRAERGMTGPGERSRTEVGAVASAAEVGVSGGRLAVTVDAETRVETAMLGPLGRRGSWMSVSSGSPPE